ncbi:hypothetical protein MJO28_016565, partial [Puccinia striiformis f. sp. tritici]
TTNQQLLKKRQDEEKKLRRIRVLVTFIKPKNMLSQTVVINKNSKRELAIPSAITVSQLVQLTHQKLYGLQSFMQTAGLITPSITSILSGTSNDEIIAIEEVSIERTLNESL